ncbi:MAG: protein-L-isoaspartate(D-aspartate) O-methyltransferase [Candidatus Marinimicrobia bacterium]|nr:protein-L-isoaspartate(D-aspartate) O-methyltransferase [Candidatus Neomarinimicrobiota bacterium]
MVYYLLFLTITFISCSSESGNSHWWKEKAEQMVEKQIERRGIKDPRVLKVMRETPRHHFIPPHLEKMAYNDGPLPIGEGQTISQPYIVALMTELLELKGDEKMLEIGTGSGYQAAVLSALVSQVFSIEIVKNLVDSATVRLNKLGYKNITTRWGDGYIGWPEEAPFDGIIVTAAPDKIPQPLIDQLMVGGRLVVPTGTRRQELKIITKNDDGTIQSKNIIPVRFVPMVHPEDGNLDKGLEVDR